MEPLMRLPDQEGIQKAVASFPFLQQRVHLWRLVTNRNRGVISYLRHSISQTLE